MVVEESTTDNGVFTDSNKVTSRDLGIVIKLSLFLCAGTVILSVQ